MHSFSLKSVFFKVKVFLKHLQSKPIFARTLLFFSIFYTASLFYLSLDEIKRINWSDLYPTLLICFLLVALSTCLQAISWGFLMNRALILGKYDLLVYFKTILMKRLPGGIWHWMGRNQLYADSTEKKGNYVTKGNALEWLGLCLSGISLHLITYNVYSGIIFGIALFLLYFIIIKRWLGQAKPLKLSLAIYITYFICWALGSLLLFLLIRGGHKEIFFSFQQATQTWTATGVITTLFFFLPSGVIVKELTLASLLNGVLPIKAILLLSLQLRILMLISEVIIGLSGYFLLIHNSKDIKAN